MSIEAAIAKLTAAVEANTAALQAAGIAPGTQVNPKADKAEAIAASGPGYWKTADGSEVGAFQNIAEFQAAQEARDEKLVEIGKTEFQELKKQIAADEAETAEKKAAAEKKAKAAKAKAEKEKAAKAEGTDHPSEDDLIAKAKEYLPADLDKDERARRHGIVKPKLDEMKVKKATDLKPEQRQEFIDFIDQCLAELDGSSEDDGDDDLV